MELVLLPLLIVLFCFLILYLYCRRLQSSSQKRSPVHPTEWPIVGHLPDLAGNIHRCHDWFTGVLAGAGHSFDLRLPGQRYFVTCDPSNVHHIFTSNFANYPKGHDFAEMFDVFGAGILNADGEPWRRQRATATALFAGARFRAMVARCSRAKVEKILLPLLAGAAADAAAPPCDLQELFMRLSFDVVCALVLGVDDAAAGDELPAVAPFVRAVDVAMETAWFRHLIPMPCWKLMRRLRLGPERDMAAALRTIDGFVADTVARRRRRPLNGDDILSSLLRDGDGDDDESIRDTAVSFLVAGRDAVAVTLTWFFYHVSTNPRVEKKLLDELAGVVATRRRVDDDAGGGAMVTFDAAELKSLAYLHAALCECLRLYPPVPFEHKAAAAGDVLPSGKELEAGDKVIVAAYAMGRMAGVWGEDCAEFRPERWLILNEHDRRLRLRHEPSYKFIAFNAGPRMCPGKDMAFARMKTAAAAVLWNFAVEVVPGHVVEPKLSATLHMKNGLLVRVHRRERERP